MSTYRVLDLPPCAPTKRQWRWYADWPRTILTALSPASLTNRVEPRRVACALRLTSSATYADIGISHVSNHRPDSPDGELANIKQAAKVLNIAPSTIHRWLNDGFIAGEQITPGAPWQIRLTEELRNRFVDQAPEGYVTMQEATKILGVTRQTVLQRVKNGELDAVHVYRGRRKGLRINVIDIQTDLFNPSS